MGVDHSVIAQPKEQPDFPSAIPGDVVNAWEHPEIVGSTSTAWFMAEVLYFAGSADPKAPSLFQVANIDTGIISFANVDYVEKVLISTKSPHITFA